MPDKVKVLYDALAGEYDLGSFDEFRSKMSDQTKRKALYDAAGKDYDLGTFDEFNRKMSPAGPVAPAQTPVQGMPTFQEQLPTMQGAAESQSKYTPAVARDKSNAGKLAATIYNGLVGSFESLAGFGAEALGELATRIPTPQYDIGGNKLNTTIYDLSPEQQVEAKRGLKKSVREGFDVLKSGYVTKEEEQQLQGKFDLTNGIGLDDFVGLTAMSGRMAGDVGLGVATGGASFAMQAYSDSGDEYDEAAEKMGIQSNPTARMLYATTGAVINGLLEKYAIDKIVGSGPIFKSLQRKALANVLKNTAGMTGKAAIDAIQTVANREVRSLVSSVVPQLRKAGYRSLVEGGTEGLQTLAQEGAKVATNWVQEQEVFNQKEIKDNLFKNVLNSAAAGAVYGPVIGFGMDKTFGSQINMEVLNDIANAKTPEDFDRINKDLEQTFTENNFNEEERAMVLDNARRYAEVKQTLPADTPAEAQVVAIPKIEERIKLDNEIQKMQSQLETVDESLRGSIEQDISVLQDKRAQINDEVVEAVTGQKFEYIEDNGKFFKKTPDGKAEEITESRYNLEQIKLEEDAIKKGQGPIQEGGTVSDIGQRQGTQEGGTQKAPAQADSRYRNISSEETVGIPMLLGSKVTYKVGNRKITGTLIQEGQTLSVENETGDVVAELGNIDELSSMSPEQMNLTVIESRVEPTEQGFAVDGKELFNENENPFDAVSVDKNGNVMNVVLTTTGGKRRKFRGRVAQDLAAQISQKEDQKTQQADQRLQQEFALPTPTAPKTITTQPTIARLTEDNVADLDNVQGTPLQKKVLNDAKRVVSAIGAAVRNITGSPVSVNVHDQNSYTTAVLEAGGTEEDAKSRGFYMADDGSIHLNMDNIDSDTMLHEGFHPILDALEKFNPAVINDLFTQLESIPEAAEIIAKARRTYTGDVTQKKEAITDFVAAVADGRVVLNPSNFQKIKKFIQDMLQKLGVGQPNVSFMKVDNEQDLIKLANFVTEKFRTGEAITLEGLEGTVDKQLAGMEEDLTGEKQYDSSEGRDIDGTVPQEGTGRGPQFSKSTLANARRNVKKISELVGLKISRVVFYDMTRVGKLSIKNIKTGYTPDVDGKGGPLYSYMDDSVENQAVLAFVSINQAIQSLQRQQMFPDAAHAVASQNPLTAHLGNKSTLRALFGDGIGIFQKAANTKAQEKEIVNILLSEIDRMSKLPEGNEAKKSLDKILPKVDLKSIKTINDFRDKILLGEGDSFGKRGSILGELLQNKQSKVTAATRDAHKILHYKYGIPTIEDIAKGNNQEELGNVELGDVVKFVRPSTEPVIYTTDPAMYEMYSKKPTPAMKEGGIRIELLPEASSHESYPFVLVGENVALLEEYVGAQQLYEKYKGMKKSGTFFKLGRMKKDAVTGQVAAETPTEEKGPAFQRVAPNGQPSKLNAKQYEQVRTPEFKAWFGDWENDPANASKVLDENGEPKVYYHGTPAKDFDEFSSMGRKYIFFSPDSEFSSEYANSMGGRILPVFINARNIFNPSEINQELQDEIFDIAEKEYLERLAWMNNPEDAAYDQAYRFVKNLTNRVEDNWVHVESQTLTDFIRDKGYDAVSVRETGVNNIGVIDPNQIKSATANVGTFSTQDNRIQFQKGDKLTLRHGGETKIVKFDESKIKGGVRGELGYGYYFSEDTKYRDYGKEVTSIDASSLNIVDENSVVPSDFTNKITEWQSKIPEGGFGIGMKAIAGEYIDRIKSEINANPSVTFQDLRRNVNNQYSVDREPMWSNMMSEIGIDGLAAMQGDGTGRSTMRQAVLYPNEKLNSLIIDQPQFQKQTPTKETRKPVKVAGRTIISSKAKAKIDHLFTSSGPLGPAIRTFKEQMGGELTAEVNIAERTTKEAMKLMEKYKGVITTQDVENFLSGKAIPSSFPLDLATKLTEMRAHVDKLTDRLLDLNVIEDKETRQLYMNNKGKYLLRSYELFRAKGPVTVENVTKKLKNVDQAKVDAALKVFEQQIAKDQPNLTPQELKQEAISQANFYLSDEDMAFGGRPIEGSVNAKSISRRSQYLEDNPAIRALMGEYTDPMYKYYSSIFKLANIVSHRDYLNKLKAEGMGKFLFTKATGEATSKIASWETKSLAPLGNLYTFPEIKEALMVAEREKKNLLLFLAGHVRMMKTVYNPATHVKNLLGSLAFAVSNGHWMYLGKTLSYMKKSKSKELMELIDVLNREGVLNNNIGVGEINQYFKKHDNVDDLLKDINLKFNKETAAYLGQKTYVNLKKIPNGLKKLYALEDDIFKILGFVNETNLYARAEYKKDFDALNPDEKAKVIKEAAERVKSFYPTFSRVPKFVKGASKAFFLGNFLSFPVESVRVSYNTINQGVKEARSSNPKIRAIGVNRLAGTLLYNGAMSWLLTYASMAAGQGLSGVLGYIFDDEDEIKEREKAKKYRAPWNKDSQVLVNKFSNGKLVYSDMGSIDSYGYQREVWNTFWDNMSDKKGFSKSMAETIAKTVQPYTELDMTLEAVLNIRDGKDEFGNDIANSEAPYSERVKDYTKYISSKFAPGVVNSVFKAYRLTQEGDDEAVINEALSQLVRTYTIDLEKSFTNYVYANPGEKNTGETGFKKRLDNAESIYNRVKNSKSMSDSEKETYYQMAVEAYKNVLRDVSGYYQAAIAGGVDANKLNQILMGAKLADQNSRPELNSIVQNRYDFPDEVYIRR